MNLYNLHKDPKSLHDSENADINVILAAIKKYPTNNSDTADEDILHEIVRLGRNKKIENAMLKLDTVDTEYSAYLLIAYIKEFNINISNWPEAENIIEKSSY